MREMRALLGLYTGEKMSKLAGKTILHLTDSSSVEAVFKIGSPLEELHTEALAVLAACRANGIALKVE